MNKQPQDPKKRFLANVQFGEGECWLWTRECNQYGYGTFWLDGRTIHAQRAAYILFVGEVPPRKHIHHTCKNKRCVRPDHLSLLSAAEHAALEKNWEVAAANRRARTHCKHGHEFTPENTRLTRAGTKQCIQCTREKSRAAAEKKRGGPPRPFGWANKQKTHCPKGHEYTPENTTIGKNGGRFCRACKMLRYYANHEREKAKMRERKRVRQERLRDME